MVLIFSIYFEFSLRGEKRGEKTQIHTKGFYSKVEVPLTCIKPHDTNSHNINRPQQQHFFLCLLTTQSPWRSEPLSLPQPSISALSDGSHHASHSTQAGASWRACVTQLWQQQHLPAPSPGHSGRWATDPNFWRTLGRHSWYPLEAPSAKHMDVQEKRGR